MFEFQAEFHTVVIVILLLAVIGLVGYIVWIEEKLFSHEKALSLIWPSLNTYQQQIMLESSKAVCILVSVMRQPR